MRPGGMAATGLASIGATGGITGRCTPGIYGVTWAVTQPGTRMPGEPEHLARCAASEHTGVPGERGTCPYSLITDRTLPAGSVNQAMSGPLSRMTPLSSWGM